jgi:hypothetical protein
MISYNIVCYSVFPFLFNLYSHLILILTLFFTITPYTLYFSNISFYFYLLFSLTPTPLTLKHHLINHHQSFYSFKVKKTMQFT